MKRKHSLVLVPLIGLSMALTACGSDDSSSDDSGSGSDSGSSDASGKIGVILPDTESSVRWESADRPALEAAFDEAGVDYDIQNAEGDTARFQSIADGMINAGVQVLLIVSLDSESGSAVIEDATAAGIPVLLTSAALAQEAVADEPVGTRFLPTGRRRPTRLLWLAHASETKGRLVVDAGAERALVQRGASLLAAGITAVEGDFSAADPVDVVSAEGTVVTLRLTPVDGAYVVSDLSTGPVLFATC